MEKSLRRYIKPAVFLVIISLAAVLLSACSSPKSAASGGSPVAAKAVTLYQLST